MEILVCNRILFKSTVILLILLVSCHSEPKQILDQTQKLKGNVRSIKEMSYLLNNTNNGLEIERKARRKSDDDDFIATFDEKRNLIQKVYYDSDGNQLTKWTYNYNMDGRCSQQKIFNQQGELYKIIDVKYDRDGCKTEKLEMNKNGLITKKYSYEYDSQQRVIKESVYYPTGGKAYFRKFSYDQNGNLLEDHWYSNEDHLYKKIQYTYNEENFKSNEIILLVDLNEVYTHWRYDYVYDNVGNWISRIDYLDDLARYHLKRVIEYE